MDTPPDIAVPRDEQRDKYKLPPALVEAIRDDAAVLQPVARVYCATVLHDMFVESKSYTPAQKKDFVELCSKLGDLLPKQRLSDSPTNGVSIVINIPPIDNQPPKSITIEQPENAETVIVHSDSSDDD